MPHANKLITPAGGPSFTRIWLPLSCGKTTFLRLLVLHGLSCCILRYHGWFGPSIQLWTVGNICRILSFLTVPATLFAQDLARQTRKVLILRTRALVCMLIPFLSQPLLKKFFVQVRLYRVRWFFEHLEFNLTMSLLWVTLIRNLIVRLLSSCRWIYDVSLI